MKATIVALRAWLKLAALASALAISGAASAQTPSVAADERRILVLLQTPLPHLRPGGGFGGGYGDAVSRSLNARTARRIAHDHGLSLVTGWPMPLLHLDCFVMSAPQARSAEAVAAEVSGDRDVVWAQPVHVFRTKALPKSQGDPLLAAQPAAAQWHLTELHRLATGDGVTVAVVDSAVDAAHPDLVGQVAVNTNYVDDHPFRPEQHGTAVAGIIAAKADNGVGIVGVAPGARLVALRACWQGDKDQTVCDSFSLARALHAAIAHKAGVINLSLGGPQDLLLSRLLQLALSRGETVVAAYDPNLPAGGFPASEPGVLAVSDAPVETPGAKVYVAPGRGVPTTEPGGRWYLVDGSSFAAAHVSGLAALIQQRRKHAEGARAIAPVVTKGGVVDACASLVQTSAHCDCSCAVDFALAARPHP